MTGSWFLFQVGLVKKKKTPRSFFIAIKSNEFPKTMAKCKSRQRVYNILNHFYSIKRCMADIVRRKGRLWSE